MKKLAYVDALRGIAILLVILGHCSQFGANNYGDLLTLFLGKAEYGVQLFYIASAFTLFLSFNNRINKEKSPNLNFFLRRFFRIAPMFYLMVLFYLWQRNAWTDSVPDLVYSKIIAQFFLIHGFSPYWMSSVVPGGWSVGLEISFYMIIPFLFIKIRTLNSALLFFLLAVLFQYLLKILFIHYPLISNASLWSRYIYCYLPSQLPVFALGIILFHLLTTERNNWSVKPFVFLLLFILLVLQFWLNINLLPDFIFISIGFLFWAYSLAKIKNLIFVNPVINYIGKLSYSMYLIHFAILQVLINFDFTDFVPNNSHYTINLLLRFSLVLLISVIISTITYYTIEKPMQKLGNSLITRLEQNSKNK